MLLRRTMPADFRRQMLEPAIDAFSDLWQEASRSRRAFARSRLLARELAALAKESYAEHAGGSHRRRRRGPGGDIVADVRLGLRHLQKNASFTALALTALALGIGLNTAVFSLADAVFVDELPYPSAERLGVVSMERAGDVDSGFAASLLDVTDLSERQRAFDAVSPFLDWQSVNVTGGERAERISVNFVTPSYSEILGFETAHGRLFLRGEGDFVAREPEVVLAHGLWHRLFGGDATVVGRTVALNGIPFEIVGVLDEDAGHLQRFEQTPDALIPLGWVPRLVDLDLLERRTARYVLALTSRREGVSREQADADLARVSEMLAREHPDSNRGWRFTMQSLPEFLFGRTRATALILMAGAGLVLLLVCVNLAGLLGIQSTTRTRELAIRQALGAGAGRLRRQLMVESLLLSAAGGVLGVAVASWAVRLLATVDAFSVPAFASIDMDSTVLAVSLVLVIFTALSVGLVPAHRAARVDAMVLLRTGGGAARGDGARSLLPSLEIALAVVLMTGAVLTFESFRVLHTTELGFDTDELLTARIDLRDERYDAPGPRRAVVDELVAGARSIPGVDDALSWSPSRLGGGNWIRFVTREGRYHETHERVEASRHHILPGSFQRLGIPLIDGRDFDATDRDGSRPVVVVSAALAGRLWKGEPAVGKRLEGGRGDGALTYEVVGVASNVRHRSRVEAFLQGEYDVYHPYAQEPERYLSLLVRVGEASTISAVADGLRRVVAGVDPNLAVYDVQTMEERMRREEAGTRTSAVVLVGYAALAMALAVIGIYGTLALAVRQRVREIGIRIALGARWRDIVAHVLGRVVKTLSLGALLGFTGAFTTARWLASALYGVSTIDPARLAVVILGLVLVVASGLYLPVRRAGRIHPTAVLRQE